MIICRQTELFNQQSSFSNPKPSLSAKKQAFQTKTCADGINMHLEFYRSVCLLILKCVLWKLKHNLYHHFFRLNADYYVI